MLCSIVDFAHEMRAVPFDERFNCLLEIAGLSAWDLGGDAQRKTGCMCDANGDVGTFLRVDAPQKCQILF